MRFSLHQFSEVLHVHDSKGLPYVLVGGQAVNYWAERYLPTEPFLHELVPFTSEDIDFHGNREDVARIAAQLDLSPVYPHRVEMTALAGAIPFRIGDLKSNIEIVHRVPGTSSGTISALAVQAEFSGRQIRVLNPVSLLVSKMELAFTISQEKRQDVEHLKILVFCVRGFLRDLLKEAESGDVPIKGWLGAVNKTMRLSESSRGRKASERFGLGWGDILPLDEIGQSTHPKVIQFRENRLIRWNWR